MSRKQSAYLDDLLSDDDAGAPAPAPAPTIRPRSSTLLSRATTLDRLASGEVRVYFVRVGDWGNVQFVTAPRSGGTREAPPSPPQQMA